MFLIIIILLSKYILIIKILFCCFLIILILLSTYILIVMFNCNPLMFIYQNIIIQLYFNFGGICYPVLIT